MKFSVTIIALVLVKCEASPQSSSYVCDLYLAPSLAGLGRGIIAGRDFKELDDIQDAPCVVMSQKYVRQDWMFWNYVWKAPEPDTGLVAAALGAASIYNHRSIDYQITNTWREHFHSIFRGITREAHITYPFFTQFAVRDIMAGEELFVSYGDNWLNQRDIFYNQSRLEHVPIYSLGYLESVGHCLSNVYVKPSTFPKAGNGLFAKIAFRKGDIVTISPVGFHPRHEIEAASVDSVVINFSFIHDGSDIAIFPFGLAGMVNNGGTQSNLYIEWYSWGSNRSNLESILELSPAQLITIAHAPLDLAYRATRDIEADEELSVYYGTAWEVAWNAYLMRLASWLKLRENDLPELTPVSADRPLFRHGIVAPEGLFPAHWLSDCVGSTCSTEMPKNETKDALLALQYAREGYPKKLYGNSSIIVNNTDSSLAVCDIYLAPSKFPLLGRALIAGRPFGVNETIEEDPIIPIKEADISKNWVLSNYVWYSDDKSYNLAVFGPGSLLNHRSSHQITHRKINVSFIELPPSEPYTTYPPFVHYTTTKIDVGEELFTSYGSTWLSDRGIQDFEDDLLNITPFTLEELKAVGHCASHVFVANSTLPAAGKGLFTKVSFKKGDTVTISPVGVLPRHEVEAASGSSVMLNYCFSSPESDVALFPLGLAGMANHGGLDSNVVVDWYAWKSNATLQEMLQKPALNLSLYTYAPLDIALQATRDIEAGEELTLYYGASWEAAWMAYLEQTIAWLSADDEDLGVKFLKHLNKPQFRHSVEVPKGMFPAHWNTPCFGSSCDIKIVNETQDVLLALKHLNHGYPDRLSTRPAHVCDLYYAPSRVSGLPYGLFAGRDFVKMETLEEGPSVTFRSTSRLVNTMLERVMYSSSDPRYQMIVFGPGNSYNHHNNYSAEFAWRAWPIPPMTYPAEGYSNYTRVQHYAFYNVTAGQELFSFYSSTYNGPNAADRVHSDVSAVPKYTVEELRSIGHCVSDIFVLESVLPKAGNGLFSKVAYRKGDVISISAVVIFPRHLLSEAKDDSVLMNYCLVSPGSDVALLPIGYPAVANHAGAAANMRPEWTGWRFGSLNALLQPVEALMDAPSPPLDLAYRATKDIEIGEELTIDYGAAWESEWRVYLEAMMTWLTDKKDGKRSRRPLFRQAVQAPAGLYPQHWMVECVGSTCGVPFTEEIADSEASEVEKALRKAEERLRKIAHKSVLYNVKVDGNVE